MFTIVGKVRKAGNFDGNEYDNTRLHCTRLGNENKGEIGTICEVFKVKTEIAKIYNIGDNINVYYDKYGNVASIVAE